MFILLLIKIIKKKKIYIKQFTLINQQEITNVTIGTLCAVKITHKVVKNKTNMLLSKKIQTKDLTAMDIITCTTDV